MGQNSSDYNLALYLIADDEFYHRDNAIEAARRSANGHLDKKITGKYFFIIHPYPHHVIRENKMVAGAGADRIQQGMRRSFGKPTHAAAKIRKGQKVITLKTYVQNEEVARVALTRAARKLSGRFKIVKEELHG